MTPADVNKAYAALRVVQHARETIHRLKEHKVIGVRLYAGVVLGDAYTEGTGKHVGWPQDLAVVMTEALHRWAADRLENAITEARALGIEVEDEVKEDA